MAPWIRQHAFSLFVGIFVFQLSLLTEGADLPTIEHPEDNENE